MDQRSESASSVSGQRRRVAEAFAADGELSRSIAGFHPRASQREMALAVFDAIVARDTLVVEAGTGTGKTFAYLVPALMAGGKILISTGTKTLQDQIFNKDLALLMHGLGFCAEAALLKGRQNYVCLHRLARVEAEGLLSSRQEIVHLRAISRFARTSASGDRAELAEVPESAAVWPQVTSTRENCLGQECPRFDDCFVYKARRAAQAADVVVVNHHLFLADLALRDDAVRDFLPLADTVVLDEAHQLPKIAADFFGAGWSTGQLVDVMQDVRVIGLALARDGAAWIILTQAVEACSRSLRLALAESGVLVGSRLALDRIRQPRLISGQMARLDAALLDVHNALQRNAERDPELQGLVARVDMLRSQIGSWIEALDATSFGHDAADAACDSDDKALVRWVALTAHGAQFHATPLAPGAAFARAREGQSQAWVLTSATLTLANGFAAFLHDIGLPDAAHARWESPFDYAAQALLYLPQPMSSPLAPDFPEQVAEAAWPVIAAAGGRSFVLCSTLRAVERVAQRLREKMAAGDAELPLLVQGTSTRSVLLDQFRRCGNAVLVGSVSFWEGVDVRGEALSVVIIDKLPFAPPDDPVVEARIRRLRALGRNPFLDYQLPQAVTLLKQGAGRLIRDERDRGVLMLCDERIISKPYGRTVLASLPPFARTRDLAEVQGFFG